METPWEPVCLLEAYEADPCRWPTLSLDRLRRPREVADFRMEDGSLVAFLEGDRAYGQKSRRSSRASPEL